MSKDKILGAMKKTGKPMKAAEIAVATGLERKEVDALMKELKNEGQIVSPKVCYWQPK